MLKKNILVLAMLTIIVALIFSLVGCKKEDVNTFFVDDSNSKDNFELSKFFNIKKVIKLETNENSIMGYIDSLRCNQGKISFRCCEQNQILSFDLNGDFVKSWIKTGNGPGETQKNSLRGFCFTPQGYLFNPNLIRWQLFNKKRELIKEIRTPYGTRIHDCIYHKDSIFAVLREQKGQKNKPIIYKISVPDLRIVKEYGKADNPLRWYNGGTDLLASYQDYIIFTSQNALQLNFLNTQTGEIEIWSPKFKDDKVNKLIIPNSGEAGRLRWDQISHFNKYLYLKYRRCTGTVLGKQKFYSFHHLIFNIRNKKCAEIYSFNKSTIKKEKRWWYIRGACGDYLVAVCTDAEEFNKHKDKYPKLSNIKFNIDDNPIILLLEPKKEILP